MILRSIEVLIVIWKQKNLTHTIARGIDRYILGFIPQELSIMVCSFLNLVFFQMSSPDFPHIGQTWHIIKAQPTANKVGPLGKRAGVDIRENFNDVVRFHLFDDAGLWANIGQGNYTTDKMMRNLRDMKKINQTVSYQRVDQSKVDVEVYIMERAYHNAPETYLSMLLVMHDKTAETEQSYIRPDGQYYEGLKKRDHEIRNTVPDNGPKIPIKNETDPKEVIKS